MKFQDKVVLITGSSRGIGKATAIAFAKEGAKVVVNYIENQSEADEVVSQIFEIGSEALAVKADVSNESEVKNMIAVVVDKWRGIDILVNNAGIVFDVPILDKTVEQWDRTLKVNLLGNFFCIKHSAPHMKGRKGASILNMSSTNGINTLSVEAADYDASKAGVISLTKNFAYELAPEIRVNCIAPGWVDTDINKGLSRDYINAEIEKISMKRWGLPDDIAKGIMFLCSEDASFITGTILVIDGGYALN